MWGPRIDWLPREVPREVNLFNYHPQTLRYQQLVDKTMVINSWLIGQDPHPQSIVDNELIVDNGVLINKQTKRNFTCKRCRDLQEGHVGGARQR